MHLDVVDLKSFYASPLGIVARRMILRGIRNRAKKLGGELTLHSAPDAGTSIRVEVPLIPGKPIARHAEALRSR